MVVFTFSVLDGKYIFWTNLPQKIKIVSLSWNLLPTLILNEVNEGKRSTIIVSAILRDFEIGSCRQHFYFVAVSASMDCSLGNALNIFK